MLIAWGWIMRFTSRLLMVMVLALVACPDSGIAGGEGGRDPVDPWGGYDPVDDVLPPPSEGDPEGWNELPWEERKRQFKEWLESQYRFNQLPLPIQAELTMQGGL